MIKDILDEIANEPSSNAKMDILRKYSSNQLLRDVLYKANSNKVKYYIKQIPEYEFDKDFKHITLNTAVLMLDKISDRVFTGRHASEWLLSILQSLTTENAYVIERIILKDLKIGMGTSNINKVFPKLIEKTPYMGAKSYSEKLVRNIFAKSKLIVESISDKPIAASQLKMDGRYCNAIIENGDILLISRQGETTHVGDAKFLNELKQINGSVVLNGELTMGDSLDRYTANGIVASIVDIEGKKNNRSELETNKKIKAFEDKHGSYKESIDKIKFTVWDMITVDEYHNKKSDTSYYKRLSNLKKMLNEINTEAISLVETKYVTSLKEAMNHFKDTLNRGLEGTILKSLEDGWKDGKPNYCVKMKLEMTLDLKIIGFNYGTKGKKNEDVISTLQVTSSCGKLKTNPSGMSEEMMEYVTNNQDKLLGTVVEIRCCGLSQDSKGNWSTLHPSVIKLRDDKDDFDSLVTAKEAEEMAKLLT